MTFTQHLESLYGSIERALKDGYMLSVPLNNQRPNAAMIDGRLYLIDHDGKMYRPSV